MFHDYLFVRQFCILKWSFFKIKTEQGYVRKVKLNFGKYEYELVLEFSSALYSLIWVLFINTWEPMKAVYHVMACLTHNWFNNSAHCRSWLAMERGRPNLDVENLFSLSEPYSSLALLVMPFLILFLWSQVYFDFRCCKILSHWTHELFCSW
jgi:hypothetical protein